MEKIANYIDGQLEAPASGRYLDNFEPATGRVYISQLADTGRITFIDTETGVQRHVTAYQLNRRIE